MEKYRNARATEGESIYIIIYYTENNPQLGDAKVCESNEGPSHCYQLITWIYGFPGFCFPKQFGIALGNHGYTRFMLQVS